MQKLSALILLLPVAILFVGMERLGSICPAGPSTCTAGSATGTAAAATQCTKMEEGCAPDGCGAGGCHKSKDQPKEKDGCTCCLECPLCALVTFSPEFRLEVIRPGKTTEYAVMPDNPLSDYSQRHWKPPDPSLYS